VVEGDAMGEFSKTAGKGPSQTKKPYETPRLVEYGRVADLIAGGTGSKFEQNVAQMNKRPMM
jgi:hypothetical protein